jgi:hypothetical protein
MPGETKDGTPNPLGQDRAGRGTQMECAEFEALLSDAIDSDGDGDGAGESHGQFPGLAHPVLANKDRERFEAHRRACAICGPMFAEVQAGRQWLRSLEPVEPPTYLVRNILAATSGVLSTRSFSATAASRDGRTTPFRERMRERWDSFFTPIAAFVRQPRFAMSFGMIFFSFSLALNAAGVKASDVVKVGLRPSALRHAYIDAQIKVVKYYDNIRFVYDIESRLRELKRANAPVEPAPKEQKAKSKNNTSGQPDRPHSDHALPDERQDRNYSEDYDQPVLAALQNGAPITPVLRDTVEGAPAAVAATTDRRFV